MTPHHEHGAEGYGHRQADGGFGYCLVCASPLELRVLEGRERPTCARCGFVRYVDPKVATAVVLGDGDGVLLVRRNINPGRGKWSFPAGYVNRGEVVEEAAVREVLEEIHVRVQLAGLVGVYSGEGDPVILIVYAGVIASGRPRPDGQEISEVRRFPADELPEMAFGHDLRVLADWGHSQFAGATSLEARTWIDQSS